MPHDSEASLCGNFDSRVGMASTVNATGDPLAQPIDVLSCPYGGGSVSCDSVAPLCRNCDSGMGMASCGASPGDSASHNSMVSLCGNCDSGMGVAYISRMSRQLDGLSACP